MIVCSSEKHASSDESLTAQREDVEDVPFEGSAFGSTVDWSAGGLHALHLSAVESKGNNRDVRAQSAMSMQPSVQPLCFPPMSNHRQNRMSEVHGGDTGTSRQPKGVQI